MDIRRNRAISRVTSVNHFTLSESHKRDTFFCLQSGSKCHRVPVIHACCTPRTPPAGCPAAALSFLADLLAAVRGPADAEVQQLQRLAVHLHVEGEDGEGEQGLFAGRGPGAEARETEAGGAAPADPLELTGSVDYLR